MNNFLNYFLLWFSTRKSQQTIIYPKYLIYEPYLLCISYTIVHSAYNSKGIDGLLCLWNFIIQLITLLKYSLSPQHQHLLDLEPLSLHLFIIALYLSKPFSIIALYSYLSTLLPPALSASLAQMPFDSRLIYHN